MEAEHLHYGSNVIVNMDTVLSLSGAPIWIDSLFASLVAIFMILMARIILIKSLNMYFQKPATS